MRNVAYLAAIVAVIAGASWFAFDPARAGTKASYLCFAVPTIALAIAGVLRARNDGVVVGWFGIRSGDITRGVTAGALLFGGAFVFMKMVAPPESPRSAWFARFYLQLGDPGVLRKEVIAIVLAMVVLAVAEELLWRGLVISLLSEIIGTRRAWIWQAVLYALAHLPTVWVLRDTDIGPNPLVLLAAFGSGLVWGAMARRFERLLPNVISHVLVYWIVLMMFRLWGPSV